MRSFMSEVRFKIKDNKTLIYNYTKQNVKTTAKKCCEDGHEPDTSCNESVGPMYHWVYKNTRDNKRISA